MFTFIVGPISKIREVREGEKDYSKRLDPYDVRMIVLVLHCVESLNKKVQMYWGSVSNFNDSPWLDLSFFLTGGDLVTIQVSYLKNDKMI